MSTYINCSDYTRFPTTTIDDRTFLTPPNFKQNSQIVDFIYGQNATLDKCDIVRLIAGMGACQLPAVGDYVKWRMQHTTDAFYRNDLEASHLINDTCQLSLHLPPNLPPVKPISQLVYPSGWVPPKQDLPCQSENCSI